MVSARFAKRLGAKGMAIMMAATVATRYTLSVVMIVKNEAKNLAISLPTLADLPCEIIILDSGSTDNTQQIAAQYGAKWFENTDWQGFGKQRQLAQSYATGDWILALDADEALTPTLKNSILAVLDTPPAAIVYGIKRIDWVFGHPIDNPFLAIKAHWRLYPNTFGYNDNLVHESVELHYCDKNDLAQNLDNNHFTKNKKAQTKILRGFLNHHTGETPFFWLEKRLQYADAWAAQKYKVGKKTTMTNVIIHTFWAFVKQYIIDGRFLKGKYGLIYSLFFMQYTFNKYAILYDLTHNKAQNTFLAYRQKNTNYKKFFNKVSKKSTLSLVMICKNEAHHLADCLDSIVDLCDEIIILDSGSTDNTQQIAAQYGAKWFENTDWQGFGKQRQLAQSYATGDYTLVLDADERVDGTLRVAIAAVLAKPVTRSKVFAVKRVNLFCGVMVQKFYADQLVRLYARDTYTYSNLKVHESLDQKGAKIVVLSGKLAHLTNDNLHHFLAKNIRYSFDWANEKHENGKQIGFFSILLRAWFSFMREYLIRLDVLSGAYGFILAFASFGYTLDKYVMLYIMNKQNK